MDVSRIGLRRWGLVGLLALGLSGSGLPVLARTAPIPQPAPTSQPADSDADGYPDAAELRGQDRERFADWFASIAQSQYYGPNADWRPEDRDCGGLLRYAYTEALKTHDPAWFARFRYLPRPTQPAVQHLSYPLPIIGRSVFRVAGGAYRAGDVQAGRLVGRSSVQYLATHAMHRVSRVLGQARRGDLLIFIRPGLRSYHSMVYLGGGLVVYHTGASPAEGGEVRLLSIQTLLRHPDAAFHPVASNPNFLGVYRWKILD